MTYTLIRNIHIEQVCNLRNVNIDLEALGGRPRHLIITGKNGSGKTMLLNSIAGYLSSVCEGECPSEIKKLLADTGHDLVDLHGDPAKNETAIRSLITTFKENESRLEAASHGIYLVFSVPDTEIHRLWQEGDCILAHFTAHRSSETIVPEHKEKDPLAESYAVEETPRDQLARYFLNLKMTQTLAIANGRKELAAEIGRWFDRVRDICREVYEDPTLELDFDVETFRFSISRQGREPHDLNGASDGLSALLDIIFNLLLRMVRKNGHSTEFDLPGIVLIDEVEAHLHLSLQRRVLPILTGLFPNVQFIVTTHSPFVLSSIENATLIDLEARVLVRGGLVGSTYESIVEGYFNVDALSEDLRQKFDRYRELSAKEALSDEEFLEARKLELSLDEVPDFLALSIAAEYQKAKLELHNKAVG